MNIIYGGFPVNDALIKKLLQEENLKLREVIANLKVHAEFTNFEKALLRDADAIRVEIKKYTEGNK